MSRQNDMSKSKQVRIGLDIHRALRIRSANEGRTIKSLVEKIIVKFLGEN